MLKRKRVFKRMNELGTQKTPFVFIIDFNKEQGAIFPLNKIPPDIKFKIEGKATKFCKNLQFRKHPLHYSAYKKQFQEAYNHLKSKEIDLINLTCPTRVETNLNLKEIFHYSQAKYKFLWEDKFVCFSPETFIKIRNNKIFTYPMKGTIDADIDNAKHLILSDKKELNEHKTVVKLLVQDLKNVAGNVEVTKFRYTDRIKTNQKELIQTSSEITGDLKKGYNSELGSIFDALFIIGTLDVLT